MVSQLYFLDVSCHLRRAEANGRSTELPTVVEFDIASTESTNAAERTMYDAVALANSDHDAMKGPPAQLGQISDGVELASTLEDTAKSIADPWTSLVNRLEVFTDVMDKISEVRFTLMHHLFLLTSLRNERCTRTQKLRGPFCLERTRSADETNGAYLLLTSHLRIFRSFKLKILAIKVSTVFWRS